MRVRNPRYIFAPLLAVALSTVFALAQNTSELSPAASEAKSSKPAWLRIDAFVNVPLIGADIAVYDAAGKRIFGKSDATNNKAFFRRG